jgi:hypothetical protein
MHDHWLGSAWPLLFQALFHIVTPETNTPNRNWEGVMETPEEKAERIREIEMKLSALVEERENVQKKCDSEHDPKKRASFWMKIAALDDAIHKLRNDLLVRKITTH